ncbi:MAG: amidohydrolase family protein [Phycisphaerales bacterium]|nr:amidohydrolase family protein [Phycisphaerales bacterium]
MAMIQKQTPIDRRRPALVRQMPVALVLVGLAVMSVLATDRTATAQSILLQGGKIIPVVGDTIEKGDVLIKNGFIEAVGEKVDAPFDATVVDCTNKVVFPGMFDAHTWRGMDQPNESPPVTPFLNVYDAIDPSQLFFEDSLRDGVLSIHIAPGDDTVIGGMSRVVHPIGLTPSEMTTASDIALKLSITPKSGFDRMRQMATFRETFRKLDEDMKALAEKTYEDQLRKDGKDLDVPPEEAQKRGRELLKPEDVPEKDRNLLALTQGKVRAFVHCDKAMDVATGIRLAKEHGFFDQTVFVLGTEAFKAADALKAAGRPVVLDAQLIHVETDPLTGDEKETFVPKIIDDAGLEFALLRNWGSAMGERYLWYQAARCVREGVSREHALKAITLWPAEMSGLGHRLGSLEVGKDANVVVLTGDPLDMQSWVDKAYVQGIEVYERSEDIRLKRLFAEPADEQGPSTSAEGEAATEDNHEIHKNEYKDKDANPDDKPRRERREGRRPRGERRRRPRDESGE